MRYEVYKCNHLYYNACTLFIEGNRGLAVIQQRFNPELKMTWWGGIDKELAEQIVNNGYFPEVFRKFAEDCKDGLYPTIEVRKLLWQLKIKPTKKEDWETRF